MLLPENDDDYYIVKIYFALLKVKAKRLRVFHYLKNVNSATGDLQLQLLSFRLVKAFDYFTL